jgi:hypothetical protein
MRSASDNRISMASCAISMAHHQDFNESRIAFFFIKFSKMNEPLSHKFKYH